MRYVIMIVLVVAASLLLVFARSPAPAPSALQVPPPDGRNAALKYWAAWTMLDTPTREKAIMAVDWDALGTETDPDKLPAAFFEGASAIDASLIEALIQATSLRTCDFEIDYENGFGALTPHLGGVMNTARLLRLHARSRLVSGDVRRAGQCVAAMYRLAAHVANDQVTISGYTSFTIADRAHRETELLVASGGLTAADRDSLVASIRWADESDPCGLKRGLASEQRWGMDWVIATFDGPDAGRRFLEFAHQGLIGGGGQRANDMRSMDGARLSREARRSRVMYDDILTAWDQPDAPERLKTIELGVVNGDYGALALAVAPTFCSFHEKDATAKSARAKVLGLLEKAKVGP
ncbi:MAG: hypothetical protein ACKVU4_02530 [Phycisphaerales bacterium]